MRRKFGEIYIPGSDAPEVLRAHLADANPVRFGEAASGLKLHGAVGNIEGGDKPLSNMSITTLGLSGVQSANAGLRLHLSDTSNGLNYRDADSGINYT